MTDLPAAFTSEEDLEDFMTLPSSDLVADLNKVDGDILILGVAGKMGVTLARMAKRAVPHKRVIGVARFTDPDAARKLEQAGVETVKCDLADRNQVEGLDDCANVIFMAGRKFGSAGNLPLTWAMNAHVPSIVAERFKTSRIVAFSTACVYAMTEVGAGGSVEGDPLTPPGEYANSCIGRERMFEYFSARHGTPGKLVRLSYAIDMRYGVLHDVASAVLDNRPVPLEMSHVNVIWQGDANACALRLLTRTTTPTSPINISGPEIVSIRELAQVFGKLLGCTPKFSGAPAPNVWLVDTSEQQRIFGPPAVPLSTLAEWTADWVTSGRASLGKPTHFEVSDGTY